MSKQYRFCACPLDCFDVCSMRAEIIDGKVNKLEGNPEHPVTKGFICEKGRKHVERMYSPLRIKQPMKRVGDSFVEISWDEALDIISEKLKKYISEFGSLSIAQYNDGGAGGLLKNVENLFFDYLGDVTLFKGSLCWGAGIAAQNRDFGDVKGHAPEDLYNAREIIIWGRNPAETNIHLMPYIKEAKQNGARITLIDPIKTSTAAVCDWHIQLKPGGDAAFAMAAAKYMLENELYDCSFVNSCTKGFQELKAYLESCSYGRLLQIAGSDYDTVCEFVKHLVDKPASIYIGYGVQRYNNGGTAVRAIDMLGAIAGIIGIPGGGINYANKVYGRYINWDAVAAPISNNHRYVAKPRFAEDLAKLENPKVKAIFISRSNPVIQLPNTEAVVESLKNIEFKVVLDYFMTDTAQLSDLVLPVTYFMEETDIIYSSMWNSYMFYNDKLVEEYHGAKSELEIYSLLAEKLGISEFPQLTPEEWIHRLLEKLPQIDFDLVELKQKTYAIPKLEIPWSDFKFETASGKFEFIEAEVLEGYAAMQEEACQYAFRLITVHTRESLHSQHLMNSTQKHPEVYISNTDSTVIKQLNLKNGELVSLENQYGSLIAQVSFTDKAQRGVLYMKEGWWFKNGGSVNSLTSHALSDIGDQAIYNECRVNIIKLGVKNE